MSTRQVRVVALTGSAWLLAACGAAQGSTTPTSSASAAPTSTATASSTPSPTAAPAHDAIVLIQSDGTLLLLRDDGTVLGRHKFAPATDFFLRSVGAAGRFWYIDTNDHHLHTIAPDGTDSTVAPLADVGTNLVNGLAVSPDGTRWTWGIQVTVANGSTTRTHIDVAGEGAATRTALDEATSNPVLSPVAWTPRGILVARNNTGIGGCCYLTPETGGRDTMLLDPDTLQVTTAWPGCATAAASPSGSFICVTDNSRGLVAHPASGADVTLHPIPPVLHAGWALVDDAAHRAVFGVMHSIGGGINGPYAIDTESEDLNGGSASKLAVQQIPDAVLPDGSVVLTSAPADVGKFLPSVVTLQRPSGATVQLGPSGAQFVAAFPLA